MNRVEKIGVTIITGFLGAGKTTFINQLLKHYRETQFALVENEFGEVSIDTKLIKGVDASQMFELKQGCICCTISDEFELVLQELAKRFPNVEHLLIETTGIADPASVIRPFFTDENLKEIYRYNGTICLVDAVNFENLHEKEITIKQLVAADLILVSKTEKLSGTQTDILRKTLHKINPFVEIQFYQLTETNLLVSIGDLEVRNKLLNITDSILQHQKAKFHFIGISTSHSKISSKTLRFNKPLKKEEFIRWLTYTLDIYKNEFYRTKGILCFENEPFEYILQGVGGSFELVEGEEFVQSENSVIVFIGRNIPDIQFN